MTNLDTVVVNFAGNDDEIQDINIGNATIDDGSKPKDQKAAPTFTKSELLDYKFNHFNVQSLTCMMVHFCRKFVIDNAKDIYKGVDFSNKNIIESLKLKLELPGTMKIFFVCVLKARKNVQNPTSLKDYIINIKIIGQSKYRKVPDL